MTCGSPLKPRKGRFPKGFTPHTLANPGPVGSGNFACFRSHNQCERTFRDIYVHHDDVCAGYEIHTRSRLISWHMADPPSPSTTVPRRSDPPTVSTRLSPRHPFSDVVIHIQDVPTGRRSVRSEKIIQLSSQPTRRTTESDYRVGRHRMIPTSRLIAYPFREIRASSCPGFAFRIIGPVRNADNQQPGITLTKRSVHDLCSPSLHRVSTIYYM